ncbi:MBL fold metallo-hydrolase [Glaciimonas immobilis]|uniref:beta-lactamase n=1 Tax=Glaciimonas immobilis TaxID=728004 RepID=A0A840RT82_9BURK|nr:MBL fold metallo-hydrolase [Glaciimonas immobilis]MBB5199669.1 glyoxylase-like metal-dependent hydrolase (beta-lactamase superfamily II) [Glaciimonas immobilis]
MRDLFPPTIHVLQRGWLSSNNILFVGREQTALIDSGYATHAPQTVALVAEVLQGRSLDWLINTHIHSDHCGGNAALQQAYGCRTSIPAAEASRVRDWDQSALGYLATGQQCARFNFDDTLQGGDEIMLGDVGWQVLAAPGHDPHSLIFYCPQYRTLISADALWEKGFGVIFPELDGESGFAEARATLEMIAELDIALVIPGHGQPFTDIASALTFANSRLDYLSAEPARNAQNALKVLLKFLLLEHQQLSLAEVSRIVATTPLIVSTNARHLHLSDTELTTWLIAQLVRAGAAKVDGDSLLNAD